MQLKIEMGLLPYIFCFSCQAGSYDQYNLMKKDTFLQMN